MGKDLNGKNLGKGIRQKSNGLYEARYVDHYGKRNSIYSKSKVEIRDKLAKAQKADSKKQNVRKRLTVNTWYEEWFQLYIANKTSPSTQVYYRQIFTKHILPEIGPMYLDEVRAVHVQNLINKLDEQGLQWETQNKVRLLISTLFKRAIADDYAIKNPVDGIKLAKKKKSKRRVLSPEEQKTFLEYSKGTFYENLYIVALNTGLRPGELCALEKEDIDFESATVRVSKTLLYQKLEGDQKKTFHLGPPKTGTSSREVPLLPVCVDALKRQILQKKELSLRYRRSDEFANLLFVTSHNTPICSQIFKDCIDKVVDEINADRETEDHFLKFSAHTFRHTFATNCLEAGIPIKVVQHYLGHATIDMTSNLYMHVSMDLEKKELSKLDPDAELPYEHDPIPENRYLWLVEKGVNVG